MRVVIVGAGEVGLQIARVLTTEGVEVVVVDKSKEKLKRITDELDIAVVEGEGGIPSVLEEAGAHKSDILLAVTDIDEINIVACSVAKEVFSIPRNVARIRNLEYIKNEALLLSLGINPAISPEVESAKAVIRLLELPFAADVEDFEGGKIKIIGFRIPPDSKLIGKALKDLDLTKPKVLIGAIQRSDRTIVASGNDIIKKSDVIFLPVKAKDILPVCNSIGGLSHNVKRIMIVGGGRIGYYVAKTMEERNINIKIIERDTDRCKFLLKSLKKCVILHGDGSDQKLLEEENINDMDIFAAISNNEELNIMASLLAKSLGAKKVIAVVNRTDYLPLANNLGIEIVLSPRIITADAILRYVRKGNVLSLTSIADGKVEVMETEINEKSTLVGKTLYDVELPQKALIGAIVRDHDIIIPSGGDRVLQGDKLIVFTLKESIKRVEELFQ
jgi:trk system potassium uptake protein TrkA